MVAALDTPQKIRAVLAPSLKFQNKNGFAINCVRTSSVNIPS